MPIYELGDDQFVRIDAITEGDVLAHVCPDCEEGKLVVESQVSRYGPELYLVCNNDDCGRAFYPQH